MKRKYLLLILDDVDEMREWIREIISARFSGWRIRTASSAVEFHQELERERPSLALMDEVLGPGEDLASLLKVAEAQLIPVALMTGMDPAHRNPARIPTGVMRRTVKPSWDTGEGVNEFLDEIGEVMALTESGKIG